MALSLVGSLFRSACVWPEFVGRWLEDEFNFCLLDGTAESLPSFWGGLFRLYNRFFEDFRAWLWTCQQCSWHAFNCSNVPSKRIQEATTTSKLSNPGAVIALRKTLRAPSTLRLISKCANSIHMPDSLGLSALSMTMVQNSSPFSRSLNGPYSKRPSAISRNSIRPTRQTDDPTCPKPIRRCGVIFPPPCQRYSLYFVADTLDIPTKLWKTTIRLVEFACACAAPLWYKWERARDLFNFHNNHMETIHDSIWMMHMFTGCKSSRQSLVYLFIAGVFDGSQWRCCGWW